MKRNYCEADPFNFEKKSRILAWTFMDKEQQRNWWKR